MLKVFAGGIGGSVNEGITAMFSDILQESLKISRDRFYIKVAAPDLFCLCFAHLSPRRPLPWFRDFQSPPPPGHSGGLPITAMYLALLVKGMIG